MEEMFSFQDLGLAHWRRKYKLRHKISIKTILVKTAETQYKRYFVLRERRILIIKHKYRMNSLTYAAN